MDKATQKSRVDKLGFLNVANQLREIYRSQNKVFSYKEIGVPQGGALSGLIANIVLHNVDTTILRHRAKFCYLRFCDDMILLSPDKENCLDVFTHYMQSIRENLLAVHEPKKLVDYTKENKKAFWETKSKRPYSWTRNDFPWVAFVGYQIKHDGTIRISKKSIDKQKGKIIDMLNEYKILFKKPNSILQKMSIKYMKDSIEDRLISLSVGRTKLYNYKKYRPVLCWIAGFKAITKNYILGKQLKELDHYKCGVLRKFFKFLDSKKSCFSTTSTKKKKRRKKKENVKYHGRPFSYHGALENEITNEKLYENQV
ncbi:MAG: RNA-directed DNA polymerase [Prevotellaceae bacterium]|nr:RNA-directed DNA polymerase [Prevotellaceae bacterium]